MTHEERTQKAFLINFIDAALKNPVMHETMILCIGEVADPPEDDGESDYEMMERLKGLPLNLLESMVENFALKHKEI